MSRAPSMLAAVLALSSIAGCAGPTLYGYPPELPGGLPPMRAALVYRPLFVASELRDTATAAFGTGGATAFNGAEVRAAELNRHLESVLSERAADYRTEGQTSPADSGPTLLVRFQLDSYSEEVDRADEDVAACTIGGSLTLGLLYLPCVGTRHDTTHHATVTMVIFDVTQAPLERVMSEDTGDFRMTYDTSSSPSLHRSYDVDFRSGVGAMGATSVTDLEALTRRQGHRLATLVLARAMPDFPVLADQLLAQSRAVATRAPVVAQAVTPPSIASADGFVASVRARLTERAGMILACVGSPDAAVRATWDGAGVVQLSVQGRTEQDVTECVSAAVGTLDVPTGTTAGTLLHAVAR